jgi:hypothetical protein
MRVDMWRAAALEVPAVFVVGIYDALTGHPLRGVLIAAAAIVAFVVIANHKAA